MNLKFLALSLLLWPVVFVQAQVWPGDINNNGVVNAVDVLYFALANGTEGPARTVRGLNWREHNIDSFWQQSFADGINYAFADCNGDGRVDLVDQLAISVNQHETHGSFQGEEFSDGLPGTAPPLWLSLPTPGNNLAAVAGSTVELPLTLGSETSPVTGYAGLAFQVLIDTSGSGLRIRPVVARQDNDWLREDAGLLALNAVQALKPEGTVGLSIAHFLFDPNEEVRGHGQIGTVQLIIEEDLTLIQGSRRVDVILEPLRMINSELENLSLVGDTISLRIFADSTGMLLLNEEPEPEAEDAGISIYPNPARESVHITTQTGFITNIRMEAPDGSVVHNFQTASRRREVSLNLKGLPAGIYFLRVQLDSGKSRVELIVNLE